MCCCGIPACSILQTCSLPWYTCSILEVLLFRHCSAMVKLQYPKNLLFYTDTCSPQQQTKSPLLPLLPQRWLIRGSNRHSSYPTLLLQLTIFLISLRHRGPSWPLGGCPGQRRTQVLCASTDPVHMLTELGSLVRHLVLVENSLCLVLKVTYGPKDGSPPNLRG